MNAYANTGNDPNIVIPAFNDAMRKAEAKYGAINEEKARRIIFRVINDTKSSNFPTKLSRAKTLEGLSESERTRYHSCATIYFKDPRVSAWRRRLGKAKVATSGSSLPNSPASDDIEEEIQRWREEEAWDMAKERNEHIIGADGTDHDFRPDYTGATWSD